MSPVDRNSFYWQKVIQFPTLYVSTIVSPLLSLHQRSLIPLMHRMLLLGSPFCFISLLIFTQVSHSVDYCVLFLDKKIRSLSFGKIAGVIFHCFVFLNEFYNRLCNSTKKPCKDFGWDHFTSVDKSGSN